jgi:hypothetical protein
VFDAGFNGGMVSAVAGMAGSFTTGALGQMNMGAGLEKVLGFNSGQIGEMRGFNSLMGGLAVAGVSYAMTGETTLNALNLKDLSGGKLGSMGLLELRLGGEGGVSMRIGTGGTDVSLGTVATAIAGLGHWGKNIEIEAAAERNGMANVATGLRGLYGFGDDIDKAELESVLRGNTKLLAGSGGEGGRTEIIDGVRSVTLNGVNEADTAEKKLALALSLSHEGRRDGVVDGNNGIETRSAVLAHTEMAMRMLGDRATQSVMMGAINGSENLRSDLVAYMAAKMKGEDTLFDRYVDGTYDSSEDFWRVMRDGSYFDDGNDGAISFEDGRETVYTKNKGKQGSLEEYLGLEKGTGYELLQMSAAGFAYDGSTWTGNGGIISADVINNLIARGVISADAVSAANDVAAVSEAQPSFAQRALGAVGSLWDGIKTGAAGLAGWAGNLFKKPLSVPEAAMEEPQNYDYTVSMEQWGKLADPAFYGKYEAQVKTKTENPLNQLDSLSTQCNIFVDAALKAFGDQVYKDIMPNGSQNPNALFETWNTNPNLIQLKNGDDAWVKAQEYADAGYIVLSAASEGGSHVAFVMPKGYEYNSLPSTDWKQRERYVPPSGPIDYSPEKIKKTWPAFLQSGSYTGILSPGWAYSSDMIRRNEVYFYAYKGRRK